MAISANRSPSPTPNPNSRPNTNLRNLEAGSPMRRSFNGNPLQRPSRSFFPATPANSPSDSSSRNLLGKEGKENESDHQTVKPAKARSPAVPKGSNHFMVPTISAASKFNPSPRKKVLADRNEPTPLSLSDCDKKPLKTSNPNDEKQHSKPMFSTTNYSLVSSVSPNIAPLDADPSSIPPYDPKTNYLSPRPQFLHYRPNPRLELYLQKEKGSGTKNLEEIFLSESFTDSEYSEGSETEVSEKESEDDSSADVLIQDFQKESMDASSVEVVCESAHAKDSKPQITQVVSKELEAENSRKESEDDDSSVDEVIKKGAEAEVSGPEVAEELEPENSQKECEDASSVEVITDISKNISFDASLDEVILKESVPEVYVPEPIKEQGVVKSRVFTRAKFIPFLLVILIICLSMPLTDTPLFHRPVHGNLSSSKFYEENLSSVARNLKRWSDYSTSYVSELISSLSGVDKSRPLQFSNLTYSLVDPFIDAKWHEEIKEEDEVVEHAVFEEDDQNYEDDHFKFESERVQQPITSSDIQNGINLEEKSYVEEAFESCPEKDFDSEASETVRMEGDYDIVSDFEIDSSFGNTNEISSVEEASSDVVVVRDLLPISVIKSVTTTQDGHISESEIKPDEVRTVSENIMGVDAAFTSDLTLKKHLAISLVALALIAAAPILIFLKRRSNNTNTRSLVTPEVDDCVGESCPSEMSSFDRRSYYGKTNEVESQERKQKRALKRESLASSMDLSMSSSPSYGSFTTYERLLPRSKHGYADDEVATPVRRSSRIKKIQVTSP